MKAFKCLIFLIFISVSNFSFAYQNCIYKSSNGLKTFSTVSELCNYAKSLLGYTVTCKEESGYVNTYNISGRVGTAGQKVCTNIVCPSATEVTLKVPVNAQKYQCVNQCQYALRGCVDIDFEPGMTCSAISTGIDCGGTPPTPPKDPSDNTQTPDAPTNTPAAPGQNPSGTNTNTATTTGTSTSTSTTTTNTTDNTSTTTTTTTNNNTTNIDLSSLEKTIESVAKILGSKIDAIKEALGGDSGSENGSPDGTDLTETNSKLDDIKENGTDLNDWLKVGKENGELGDKPFGTDETPKKEITTQTLKTNIFGSSSACPADRNLSMNFLGRSFQKTFSFSLWCEHVAILGSLILISAYLFGAYIIASKS